MMNEIECTTKRWGSSLGVVIPSEVVKKEHLGPNEVIRIVIKRTPLAKMLIGLGPVKDTRSTEEIVRELRSGW